MCSKNGGVLSLSILLFPFLFPVAFLLAGLSINRSVSTLSLQDCWYGGIITKYHRRKRRHRVEYDDGDHEWINLQDECDRVQVQHEDGLWSMVSDGALGLLFAILLVVCSHCCSCDVVNGTFSPPSVCHYTDLC